MYTLGCFSTRRTERRPCFCLAVRSEHGIRYVKLPSASSASSVLRFLENLCQYLESDSVFSSQPFSPFSSGGGGGSNTRFYNRTKSGGQDLRSALISTLRFHTRGPKIRKGSVQTACGSFLPLWFVPLQSSASVFSFIHFTQVIGIDQGGGIF